MFKQSFEGYAKRYNIDLHLSKVEISTFDKCIFEMCKFLLLIYFLGVIYLVLLMFDYGHGGKDPGAVNGKREEADDVLKLGLAVAEIVRSAGIQVDETRTNDKTLSLADRSNMERRKKYNYFISFHRNAANNSSAHGVESYVYVTNNSKSRKLADEIQQAMVQCGFRDRGVKEANFHVLRETYAPAVLLEVGFISNDGDNKLFDDNFPTLAEGIAKAIINVCLKMGV